MNKIKMTKEIAYDYLRGKKVRMEIRPVAIQTLVQKIGYRWVEGGKVEFHNVYGICLGEDGIIRACEWDDIDEWDGYFWEEISPEEVLSIEIEED